MTQRRQFPARFLVFAVLGAASLGGCASALPVWQGGGTTPAGRVDTAVGAAVRVPLGDLAKVSTASLPSHSSRGGVVPAAQAQVGISENASLGILLAGTTARLDLRYGMELSREGTTVISFIPAPGIYGGVFEDESYGGDSLLGMRTGVDVPFLFAASYGSVLEVYGGPRIAAEYANVSGDDNGARITATAMSYRLGVTAGIATGFRNFHAMLELTAQHEWWDGDVGGADLGAKGLALVPSFALQLRL